MLENDALIGSVNANLRRYREAADALGAADLGWLDRIVTRRWTLARFAEAFEMRADEVTVAIMLGSAGSESGRHPDAGQRLER